MKLDKEIFLCLITGFSWSKLKNTIFTKKLDKNSLEVQVELAKKAWIIAQNQMEWADKDMLEAAILQTSACERKYMALMQKARNEHYHIWDEKQLTPAADGHG